MSNKRQQQAIATRQRLIDTAYRMIGEQGYEALSTASLVTAAGVTKGALYHHFDSLEAVAYAALENALRRSFAPIAVDTAAADTGHSAAAGATAGTAELPPTIEQYLDNFEHALFDNTLTDPVATKALFSFVRVGMFNARYRQLLKTMLEQGCEKFAADLGHYAGDNIDAEQLATIGRLLDAIVGGLGVHWYTLEQQQRTRSDWRCFRRMIIDFVT